MKVLLLADTSLLGTLVLFLGGLYEDLNWTPRLVMRPSAAVEKIQKEDFALVLVQEDLANEHLLSFLKGLPSLQIVLIGNADKAYDPSWLLLQKDLLPDDLEKNRNRLYQALAQKELYSLRIRKECIDVPYARILYLEKEERSVIFHTKLGTFRKRGTLKEFAPLFEEHGFVRIHSSFLINPRFITARKKNEVQIAQKTWLPLSRVNRKAI